MRWRPQRALRRGCARRRRARGDCQGPRQACDRVVRRNGGPGVRPPARSPGAPPPPAPTAARSSPEICSPASAPRRDTRGRRPDGATRIKRSDRRLHSRGRGGPRLAPSTRDPSPRNATSRPVESRRRYADCVTGANRTSRLEIPYPGSAEPPLGRNSDAAAPDPTRCARSCVVGTASTRAGRSRLSRAVVAAQFRGPRPSTESRPRGWAPAT